MQVALFFLFTASVGSIIHNLHWTQNAYHYIQTNILNNYMNRAAERNEIIFECVTPNSNGEFFQFNPRTLQGYTQLLIGRRIGFFIHGWGFHNRSQNDLFELSKSWSAEENINVCIVNWSKLWHRNYKIAAAYVYDVGFTLAAAVKSLEGRGTFNRNNITFAGFSLGAHAAGFAGNQLNNQIDHIIGLDPAGPMFTSPTDVGPRYRLDPSDGIFVQVLHTSRGILGVNSKSGHADFYPNGGNSPQTNCVYTTRNTILNRVVCSHGAALKFFLHSMNLRTPFIGYHCSSYGAFVFGQCNSGTVGRFGIYTNRVAGNFYFTTSKNAPFVNTL